MVQNGFWGSFEILLSLLGAFPLYGLEQKKKVFFSLKTEIGTENGVNLGQLEIFCRQKKFLEEKKSGHLELYRGPLYSRLCRGGGCTVDCAGGGLYSRSWVFWHFFFLALFFLRFLIFFFTIMKY